MKRRNSFGKLRVFIALVLVMIMCVNMLVLSSCGDLDSLFDGIFPETDPINDEDGDGDTDSKDVTGTDISDGSETADGTETDGGDGTGGEIETDGNGTEDGDGTGSSGATEGEMMSVVRVKKAAKAGACLGNEHLEVVTIHSSGVPTGAITDINQVLGKYTTIDIYLGEYIFDRMITDVSPDADGFVEYVVVSDEIENAENKDITAELQALINKYPGRTIYFSDGVYNISSPLKLSFEQEKAVSFRLSNYAVIKALPSWSSESAMIILGDSTDISKVVGAEVLIQGGIVDGSGFAKTGISIENCKNPYISNVTFKNLKTSVWAKSTADTVTLESITVNGDGSSDSIGVLMESSSGSVSTSNIANVAVGVKSNDSYNDFRNVLVYAVPGAQTKCGFWENGTNNVFEMCTSQNFSCGYLLKDSAKSIFEACNSYWDSALTINQTAFLAEGTFESIVSGCVARFFNESSDNAYITFTAKGSGVVKVPVFDESICDDQSYKSVLAGTVIPIN